MHKFELLLLYLVFGYEYGVGCELRTKSNSRLAVRIVSNLLVAIIWPYIVLARTAHRLARW